MLRQNYRSVHMLDQYVNAEPPYFHGCQDDFPRGRESEVGSMLGNLKLLGTCLLVTVLGCGYAVAQSSENRADEDKLIGHWRQGGASLVIEVKRQNNQLNAIIVREDWNPSLVGQALFQDLKYNPKSKKWTGLLLSTEREEPVAVTIKMKRSGVEFSSSSKSRQHRKVKWKETQP